MGPGRWLLVLAWIAGCQSGPAPEPTPEPTPWATSVSFAATREEVTDLVRTAMDIHGVPALALALVHGDQVVWRQEFGAATPTTLFPVGSLTKPLTAVAVLRAAQAGQIDLDAPASTYVPDFRSRASVRQLLAHQGGLPGDWLHGMWSDNPPPWQQVIAELATTPAPHPPGEVSVYSNAGYTVLGRILEEVTGQPFGRHVSETVLAPLRMTTATFERPDTASKPQVRFIPAGGLYASVDDMVRLARLVVDRGTVDGTEILPEATVGEMVRPQNQAMPLDLDVRRGLGWLLTRAELGHAGRVAWHTGWTPGHHAQLMVLLDHDLAVVVLAASATAGPVVDAVAMQTLESAPQEVVGLDPPDPAAPPLAPPLAHFSSRVDLIRFVGRYATDMSTLSISVAGGVLHARSLAGHATLRPLLDGTFDAQELSGVRVGFERIAGRDVLVFLRGGVRGFLAQRLPPAPDLSPAWRARLGPYELVDEPNPIGRGWALEILDGYPVLTYDLILEDPPTPVTMVLCPIGEEEAIVAGLGRGKGDHIHAKGPTLRWVGYTLRRM